LLLVLGADVEDAVGDADGDADDVGKIPIPGDDEPDGLGEADGVGDACALTRGAAVATDAVNMSAPVVNIIAETVARARGTVLRMGGLLSVSLIPCPACRLLCVN
jgi:hypothetical protein